MKRLYAIASLLILTLVASVVLLLIGYNSPSSRYQREHDVVNLRYLLSTQVVQGDSMRHVKSLLGPGSADDGSYLGVMLSWQSSPNFIPAASPDGIRAGDLFINYAAKPKPSYPLQFRDGKLVNHDPAWFAGPDDTISSLTGL